MLETSRCDSFLTRIRVYSCASSAFPILQSARVQPKFRLLETYHEVSGIKIPFHWTVTWLDGRSIFNLTDVQVNATINPARFTKPVAPTTPTK